MIPPTGFGDKETKKGSGFGKIVLNLMSASEQVRTAAAAK